MLFSFLFYSTILVNAVWHGVWGEIIHDSLRHCPVVGSNIIPKSTVEFPRPQHPPHPVLPTRAVPSPPESKDHISPFSSVCVRAVMLVHRVLLSGKPWNIFTSIQSSEVHLPPLIIDLHGSSLVKVQRSHHRSESHSHDTQRKKECCFKAPVNLTDQLHVSHRSLMLRFSHWGTVALGTASAFFTSQKELPRDFNLN